MLELVLEPKILDAHSWSRNLKFEFRLHSPDVNSLLSQPIFPVVLPQGLSNGALGPLGGHEKRPSLGSFAVILLNPSFTIY